MRQKRQTMTDISWYAAAVAWASENGIVKGYSSTRFGPLDELNREQMMVILYRYEQYRGGGFSGAWAFPLGYADAADVSGWAYEAACWCTMNSIVNGVGENTLVPAGKADRAQLAAVLSRYMSLHINTGSAAWDSTVVLKKSNSPFRISARP